jgi:hypothetical protein
MEQFVYITEQTEVGRKKDVGRWEKGIAAGKVSAKSI